MTRWSRYMLSGFSLVVALILVQAGWEWSHDEIHHGGGHAYHLLVLPFIGGIVFFLAIVLILVNTAPIAAARSPERKTSFWRKYAFTWLSPLACSALWVIGLLIPIAYNDPLLGESPLFFPFMKIADRMYASRASESLFALFHGIGPALQFTILGFIIDVLRGTKSRRLRMARLLYSIVALVALVFFLPLLLRPITRGEYYLEHPYYSYAAVGHGLLLTIVLLVAAQPWRRDAAPSVRPTQKESQHPGVPG